MQRRYTLGTRYSDHLSGGKRVQNMGGGGGGGGGQVQSEILS